jgi:hypothetical protein
VKVVCLDCLLGLGHLGRAHVQAQHALEPADQRHAALHVTEDCSILVSKEEEAFKSFLEKM